MSDATADVGTIRDLEKRRFCALRDGDADSLEELCADEMYYLHSNGARDTKSALLTKLRDQELVCTDAQHDPEDHVIVTGDTAIAAGRVIGTVYVHGRAVKLRNRALAVWARQAGHWRLVAYQSTPLPG